MEPANRSLVWHAAAGLGSGLGFTAVTVPFTGPYEGEVALAFYVCTPLLCMAVTALAARPQTTRAAVIRTILLAPVFGICNAILTWLLAVILRGGGGDLGMVHDGSELGLVLVFAVPAGSIPGVVFAVPLAIATWAARRGLATPAGTRSSRGTLVAVLGVTTLAGALLPLCTQDPSPLDAAYSRYPMWPLPTAVAGLGAVLCGVQALRDLTLWQSLRRLDLAKVVTRAGEAAGVMTVAPFAIGGPRSGQTLFRIDPQGDGAYRASTADRPLLVMPASLEQTQRALWRGAALLALLAALQGVMAFKIATSFMP